MNLPPAIWEVIINGGISAVLLVILLIGLYKLANKYLGQFVEAQQKQAMAIKELTCTLRDNVAQDKNEHREIVLLLKVVLEKLNRREGGEEKADAP